jgi:putative transposase
MRFFKKTINQNGYPDTDTVTIDKSGANIAALSDLNEGNIGQITIRQSKYLNNLVEQDHRTVKRIVKPTLGFKSFRSARKTLQGIELMQMIKKGQMIGCDEVLSAAGHFYSNV